MEICGRLGLRWSSQPIQKIGTLVAILDVPPDLREKVLDGVRCHMVRGQADPVDWIHTEWYATPRHAHLELGTRWWGLQAKEYRGPGPWPSPLLTEATHG